MINEIEIRNFQSIRHAKLELGSLTVIVGPSSSGKSAFIRALRTLASNSRGAAYVTHGQKHAAITAVLDGGLAAVTLERGASTGTYKVHHDELGDKEFTKLGGTVPDLVTSFLRIKPVVDGQSVNFAGQFDRPYLLDDSGAQVARTLGELTNVTVLFESAREANRLRLQASSQLKAATDELTELAAKAQEFRTLPAQIAAVEHAEQVLSTAASVEAQARDLEREVVVAAAAAQEYAQARESQVPAPPDLSSLEAALAELSAYETLVQSWVGANQAVVEHQGRVTEAQHALADADQAYTGYMLDLDVCPTCGASREHMHPESVSV